MTNDTVVQNCVILSLTDEQMADLKKFIATPQRPKMKVLARGMFDADRGGAGPCLCIGSHDTCTVESCHPVLIIADPAAGKGDGK